MSESLLRRLLAVIAVVGLAAGLLLDSLPDLAPRGLSPAAVWTAATLPVVAALLVSIVRDVLIGRLGVDAIALVSMSAALALGQSLAAVVVAIMYAGGTVLEDFARGRAQRDLRSLADRSPRIAHRRLDGRQETVQVEDVRVGDRLLVRAGELVPVDGVLADVEASLDESTVTGEPLPVRRGAGDPLRSGTVNAGDAFTMQATAKASDSTYAGIVRMVTAAQTARAPFMRIADRFALFLLPATLIVAGLAWYFSGDTLRALAVLVVATPCPLILAAPVAFIGGVSRAARSGVLMKGSGALEALAGARTAIFDKTGTLTRGGAELLHSEVAPGRDEGGVFRLLASLESASHHVLSDSVLALARTRGHSLSQPEAVKEMRGAGLEGCVDGHAVRVGSRRYVMDNQKLPFWAEDGERRFRDQPVLRVYVTVDGRLAGVFTFGDAIRADARSTLHGLRHEGVERIIMLTGDNARAAGRLSEALGLDDVVADASPADKVAAVHREMERAPSVMVGDGINDAPALASATVGVAMGARGATATSEAADIVLLTDRLTTFSQALAISRHTRRIAVQSIVVGLALSALGMAVAAFGYITPVQGALLQEGIDVAVILNALRALGGRSPGADRPRPV